MHEKTTYRKTLHFVTIQASACLGQLHPITYAFDYGKLTWDHLVSSAHEEVGDERKEGGVEAIDRRQVSQQSKRHTCTEHDS